MRCLTHTRIARPVMTSGGQCVVPCLCCHCDSSLFLNETRQEARDETVADERGVLASVISIVILNGRMVLITKLPLCQYGTLPVQRQALDFDGAAVGRLVWKCVYFLRL